MRGVKLAMSIPILISAVAAGAAAEKPTAPAPQGKGMKVVYLVLLKKGPAWTARRRRPSRKPCRKLTWRTFGPCGKPRS